MIPWNLAAETCSSPVSLVARDAIVIVITTHMFVKRQLPQKTTTPKFQLILRMGKWLLLFASAVLHQGLCPFTQVYSEVTEG